MAQEKKLTAEEEAVLLHGATEAPFSGAYHDLFQEGLYRCRQCGAPLFRSSDKFRSSCGWPSFDGALTGAIRQLPDKDGRRTEIRCAQCDGHLGHLFQGEQLTPRDQRYCVNSLSMTFEPSALPATDTAYFAGGCFWGVEHQLQKIDGVLRVTSGFMGGKTVNPSYREVCTQTTGHAETVEVLFDPSRTTYETIARRFFEIHDPTQQDGQGPDIGPQYRSEIFYTTEAQKATVRSLIERLREKGYKVVTRLTPASVFYPAEAYHQDYYEKKGTEPYCHAYTKRF